MVALPNIYSFLDWWKEIQDIDAIFQEDIWNLMEKDLHDISRGVT